MQVHPAARFAVDADDYRCGAPVGLLDPWLEENHPLQLADDVMLVPQHINLLRAEVVRVATFLDLR